MPRESNSRKPISLFYSYSHEDEWFMKRLQKHLAPLRRSGMIAEWHDRDIEAGKEWEKEIDHHLSYADIVLLLVSASFIDSEYCWSVEVKKALERHERGEARVIPVILKPCDWKDHTPFAKLQATPKNAKPITEWPSWDSAFHDVASKIKAVVDELQRSVGKAIGPAAHSVEPKVKSPERDPESFEAVVALVRAHREGLLQAKLMSAVHQVHFEPGRIEMRLAESAPNDLPRQLSRFLNQNTSRRWLVTASRSGVGPAMFRDIDAPWCPEMVALPAGEFLMGSPEREDERYDYEGPQHRVTIRYPFAIGRYPVTFAEYDHFSGITKREKPNDRDWGRGLRPVINVSWHDAQTYVEWLAKETGKPYRLLSEAEWEYACRAGTTTPFSLGETITRKEANFGGNIGKTTEVGSFPPNPWSLYDMHGNVWEWVADHWHNNYKGASTDGSAWIDDSGGAGAFRVIRGGSWNDDVRLVRSACRYWREPGYRIDYLGFRCARVLA